MHTLSQALPSGVFAPNSAEYSESLTSYFSAQESELKPACIVRPKAAADVSTILSSLVTANKTSSIGSIKFAVRSGHYASFARCANEEGVVTIDLRSLDEILLHKDLNQVTIGTGASWGKVYPTLNPLGLAVPGGDTPRLESED